MQEFSSVTASSYDAESLAPLLNDKAADGWSVVSIVAAGSNVVAYLQREVDESAANTDDTATDTGDDDTSGDAPADDAPAGEATPAAAAAAMLAAQPEAEEAPDAVEEPAGWAAAPDATADDATAAEPAPAAEPTVPAGWYADPSGRYELRYWDGLAWTEHVSRAGQQFTDAPVA